MVSIAIAGFALVTHVSCGGLRRTNSAAGSSIKAICGFRRPVDHLPQALFERLGKSKPSHGFVPSRAAAVMSGPAGVEIDHLPLSQADGSISCTLFVRGQVEIRLPFRRRCYTVIHFAVLTGRASPPLRCGRGYRTGCRPWSWRVAVDIDHFAVRQRRITSGMNFSDAPLAEIFIL
jgi:hypothetical protein